LVAWKLKKKKGKKEQRNFYHWNLGTGAGGGQLWGKKGRGEAAEFPCRTVPGGEKGGEPKKKEEEGGSEKGHG